MEKRYYLGVLDEEEHEELDHFEKKCRKCEYCENGECVCKRYVKHGNCSSCTHCHWEE